MRYDVTVYVNAGVNADPDGIEFIHPYAAYDVTNDEWTVSPDQAPYVAPNPSWDHIVERDRMAAEQIVRSYLHGVNEVRNARTDGHRRNAEVRIQQAMQAASGMYEEIHDGRRSAFSPTGGGYTDYGNYRWQAGKRTGAVHALRRLKEYWDAQEESLQRETYGVDLPDADTLIRRAATYRSAR